MGRLGTQVDSEPAVVEKDGATTWRLNKYYRPMIDAILAREPVFKDVLNEATWMQSYARPVDLDAAQSVSEPPLEKLTSGLDDQDPVLTEVRKIVASGSPGVLFSGPPGTSKTWYARQVAIKLATPACWGVPGPMGHDVELDFRAGISSNTGPKKIDAKKIHLLRANRHLENVILAPRHGHAAFPEKRNPFVRFA